MAKNTKDGILINWGPYLRIASYLSTATTMVAIDKLFYGVFLNNSNDTSR